MKPVLKKASLLEKRAKIGSREDIKAYLTYASSLTRRVEASKAVVGFFGGGLTDIIDNMLVIATPLVAIMGDFELSNLLGSLKVWLMKKKAEEVAELQQRDNMFSQSYDDMTTYNYGY